MPNQAADCLKRLSVQIMKNWEARANLEVAAAVHQTSLALQHSLPEFLSLLADSLSTAVERTKVRIKWDNDEKIRLGKAHGRERAGLMHYTMDQLIIEYHILRQLIFEALEEEIEVTSTQREIIVCAIEQAVNDAATEFSDAFRDIQEKFTDTLAHDLRGPITATKMSAQRLLKKDHSREHTVETLSRICASMDRLDLMILDLLDASRLRAGEKLSLAVEDCDLNTILRRVADETNSIHGQRVELLSDGTAIGRWNEIGLRRIADNLVGNALKFSYPGTCIKIATNKSTAGVIMEVHNRGAPIQPDQIPLLFKQFRRTETGKGKSGWGLGLTVIKGITAAHGGSVEVESFAELGTVFRVILPWDSTEPTVNAGRSGDRDRLSDDPKGDGF